MNQPRPSGRASCRRAGGASELGSHQLGGRLAGARAPRERERAPRPRRRSTWRAEAGRSGARGPSGASLEVKRAQSQRHAGQRSTAAARAGTHLQLYLVMPKALMNTPPAAVQRGSVAPRVAAARRQRRRRGQQRSNKRLRTCRARRALAAQRSELAHAADDGGRPLVQRVRARSRPARQRRVDATVALRRVHHFCLQTTGA